MAAGRNVWVETDFVGGAPCVDFVNTVQAWQDGAPQGDKLAAYDDLVRWGQAGQLVGPETARRLLARAEAEPRRAAEVLEAARALRLALFRLATAYAAEEPACPQDMELLNVWMARALGARRLMPDGTGFSLCWCSAEDLERPLWPVVESAAELLRSADPARLRRCPGEHCGWLFLDTSKGGRRRWCDMRHCGNRAKAARHYRRCKEREAC